MPRIKIKDIPKDQKITREEMRALLGAATYTNITQTILPQGEDLVKTETALFGTYDEGRAIFG